jgi:hypothetical protein
MATRSKKTPSRAAAKKPAKKATRKTAGARKKAARKQPASRGKNENQRPSKNNRREGEQEQYRNDNNQQQNRGIQPWMRNQPPQQGYVAPNVAHYMVEQNSGSNQGGRAYGQSYHSFQQGGGGFEDQGNRRQEFGYQNGQQDQFAGMRSTGDSFAQTYGQHRRGGYEPAERESEQRPRYDDRYENRGMHRFPEEPREYEVRDREYGRDSQNDFRRDEQDPGDPRYGGRHYNGGLMGHNRRENWDDNGRRYERHPQYEHERWEDREGQGYGDPTEFEYRHDGYQSSGEVEGFGYRKSRRHQGGWLGEEEYRGGHGQSFRGRGKYGSR